VDGVVAAGRQHPRDRRDGPLDAVMVGLMAMAPLHLAHGGANLRVVGLMISMHVGAMYALSPLFGWLSDRGGRGAAADLRPGPARHGLVGGAGKWVRAARRRRAGRRAAACAGPDGRTDEPRRRIRRRHGRGIVAATSYATLCAVATALRAFVLAAVVRRLRRPR
jgi:MFS family permease